MKNINFNGRGLFLLLVTVLSGPLSASAVGCMMGGDEKIELFLSPETQSWGNFDGHPEVTPSAVTRCMEDSGKYLMLTLGVARSGIESNLHDIFIFNNYHPESCQIVNSASIRSISADRQVDHFSQQFKLLRSCFELKVDDYSGAAINYRDKQEHCQIRKSPDGGVYLSGDMCFLKINSRSQFSVLPILKNECRKPEYLKQLGIMAQDLEANLDVLVAGDDSGNSIDLTQIGSRSLFMSVTPSEKILPLSENYGVETPRFTTRYNVDVDWGKLRIKPGATTQINLSVLASNLSDTVCNGQDCSRSSNFVQPVFGQVELFELNKGKKPTLLEEWWDGGFAPANWQGFVNGMGYSVDGELFTPGKQYRLQMTFQNPTDDYAIFLAGLSQILINLNTFGKGVIGIDQIPALSTLKQLGVFPMLPGTAGLKTDYQGVDLSATIKGLSKIISNNVWPTYFEKICDPSKTNCLKFGKDKFYQRLTLEFTAGEADPATGDMKLENMALQKESKVFSGYSMNKQSLPEISCGGSL